MTIAIAGCIIYIFNVGILSVLVFQELMHDIEVTRRFYGMHSSSVQVPTLTSALHNEVLFFRNLGAFLAVSFRMKACCLLCQTKLIV